MQLWSEDAKGTGKASFQSKNNSKSLAIVSELQKLFGSTKNHQLISQARSSTKLILRQIQKKPGYLADDRTCIQYLFAPKSKLEPPNPYNRLSTAFYAGHPKSYIVFNCEDQILQAATPQFPSAYHPAFHYKNYEQFRDRIRNISFDIVCDVYQISSWSICFVNVTNTCYYAPVLIVHQWRRLSETTRLLKPVQNILFDSRISRFMDDFRVADMKRQTTDKHKSMNSFNYYMRNHISNKIAPKSSKFVTLDTRGAVLETNLSIPANIIPLGGISDYERFKRPLPIKYLAQRKQLNLDMFVAPPERESSIDDNWLFEDEEIPIEQPQQVEHNFIEEAENYDMQNQMGNRLQEGQDSEEDISDQEDHLKNIYRKTLKNTTIV